tara:strand:+ start:103 stop:396 length:294 start_codon:yes stop_codon:yes gene_type:complete
MSVYESALTKGQQRKLNALRKSVGDDLAQDVFEKWLKRQSKAASVEKSDPVAEKLAAALAKLEKDPVFRLGNQGYTVRRARGKGASGFIVTKNDKSE